MEEQLNQIPPPEIPEMPVKNTVPWKLIAIILLFAVGTIGVLIGKQLFSLRP